MAPGTDDPKDLGSKKIFNQQKKSEKNEGFSGENLPDNYDPSAKKQDTEIEKDKEGNIETVKRARDINEKKAPPVNSLSAASDESGEIADKGRGTTTGAEAMETAENRDFNSDIDEDRYDKNNPDNKKSRGNINFGK